MEEQFLLVQVSAALPQLSRRVLVICWEALKMLALFWVKARLLLMLRRKGSPVLPLADYQVRIGLLQFSCVITRGHGPWCRIVRTPRSHPRPQKLYSTWTWRKIGPSRSPGYTSKLGPSHCLPFLMSGVKWVWFTYLAKYSVIPIHGLLSLSQFLSHLDFCSTFHGLLGVRSSSQQYRNKTKQNMPWFVFSSTRLSVCP